MVAEVWYKVRMDRYQTLIGLALVALAIVVAAFVMRPPRYTAVSSGRGAIVVDCFTGKIESAY